MSFFVHPQGFCESTRVGEGTRVLAFARVLSGAALGRHCVVHDHAFVDAHVTIGDRVEVKGGAQLWSGLHVQDDVTIGPNSCFTNEATPGERGEPAASRITTVEAGASIGANCTVLPGLRIGRGAAVRAGSVVTRDVPPFAIVTGNPAAVIGYANARAPSDTVPDPRSSQGSALKGEPLRARGASIVNLKVVSDPRGDLMAAEFERHVPFAVKRAFCVYSVPSREVRGEHAHKLCHQFLVAINGQLSVVVDDGVHRDEVLLDRKNVGLHLPPMIWGVQYRFSPDAVLLVFASDHYDASDYIRSYEDFLVAVRARDGSVRAHD